MTFLMTGAVVLNIYAALLVLARAFVFRTRIYRPMLLNIALSVAPILVLLGGLLAAALLMRFNQITAFVVAIAVGVIWLLMLPNASYLITELNMTHRQEGESVPLWYDIILVITLAMSGVVNTVMNVFVTHLLLATLSDSSSISDMAKPGTLAAISTMLLLVALGMYVGRFLRLNSWDVLHPTQLLRKVQNHFSEPGAILSCLGFTFTYALFIGIMYLLIVGPLMWTLYKVG